MSEIDGETVHPQSVNPDSTIEIADSLRFRGLDTSPLRVLRLQIHRSPARYLEGFLDNGQLEDQGGVFELRFQGRVLPTGSLQSIRIENRFTIGDVSENEIGISMLERHGPHSRLSMTTATLFRKNCRQ